MICSSRVCTFALGGLLLLLVGSGGAQVPPAAKSSVTVDAPKVVENKGLGTWTVVVTGTLTLGKNDTFGSYVFDFKDPNKNSVAPNVVLYQQPQPGFTTPFKYYTVTAKKGDWQAYAGLFYSTGATPGVAAITKDFTVP